MQNAKIFKQKFNIDPAIQNVTGKMIKLRHIFHQNPQTGFEETFANKKITELLDKWAVPYDIIAKTGIVVTLEGEKNTSGKVVGLRADMDALNKQEESNLPWKSTNNEKMHACGHDGHMATLLTVIEYFNNNREFNGVIKFVFQPAEEGLGGAKRMIEEGLIEKHKLDAFYTYHNWPDLPVGTAAIHASYVMASNTSYIITLNGQGGHGAMPEKTNNPINALFDLFHKIHKLRDEFVKTDPDEKVIISVGATNAGSVLSPNVIPEQAVIAGTIRTYSNEIKQSVPDLINRVAEEIALKHDMTANIEFPSNTHSTINDENKALISRKAMEDVIGHNNIIWNAEPGMTADDFGLYAKYIPTSYIWIGNASTENSNSPNNENLHSSKYDFNDNVIPIAAQYFVNIIKNELPLTIKTTSQEMIPFD